MNIKKSVHFTRITKDTNNIFNTINKTKTINSDFEYKFVKNNDNILMGYFRYEPTVRFGNPKNTEGELIFDTKNKLLGFIRTQYKPSTESIVRKLNDTDGLQIDAPKYTQKAITDFYNTYGFNGYAVTFRKNIKTYDYDSTFSYIEPEEKAKEKAMYDKFETMSDELVNEITNNLINDGYFINSMDIMLTEDGPRARFSSPLRITSIPEEEWDDKLLFIILNRVREITTNSVKTIEEVLDKNN